MSLKFPLVFIWTRRGRWGCEGKVPKKTLDNFCFSDISSFLTPPCLSLASPTLVVYERTDDVGIFFEKMWEVCYSFPTWCGLRLPEGKSLTMQTCFQHSWTAALSTGLKGLWAPLRGDSAPESGQGLGRPSLLFLKNIPLGNNLAFPAKHELAWQPDQLITAVHLMLHGWLITRTRTKKSRDYNFDRKEGQGTQIFWPQKHAVHKPTYPARRYINSLPKCWEISSASTKTTFSRLGTRWKSNFLSL